jgi:aspartyl-tRNA(Asn)/glutamyl-tRNA(Gln) amidotransferase subunit A
MTEELTWAPAWRLSELIRAREVSPVEVLDHFLGRVEEHQPVLKALEHLDEQQSRQEAKTAESAVLAGDDLGPLHGIPMAVKGHIDIAGVPETMPFGSGIARRDHPVVERLRGAGAIVIGHTAMPVLAADFSFDYEATARNPWDTGRTPGISSAGSAAALAAGLLPATLVSDGGGSSRIPAAYSGVVGMHTTPGLVPWVDPRGQTTSCTSTIGPGTRDVRDAATVLSVIAGPDARDQAGLQIDLPDPRSELHRDARGLELAWTDDFGFALDYAVDESRRVIDHIRNAALALDGVGAIVEPTDEKWDDYIDAFRVYSFAGLASMGLPGIENITDDQWDAAADVRQRSWAKFRRLFRNHDLLLCPTALCVAPPIAEFATRIPSGMAIVEIGPGAASFAIYTAMFNWLRFPAISVPCGFVDGLPVGLQIVGRPGSDATVLRLAHAFVEAFPQNERPDLSVPANARLC